MDLSKELLAAARVGDAARVARCLRQGTNPNAADWMKQTPLFLASKEGHANAVQALLAAGADANASDNYGSTPLTLAAERGFVDLVVLLLDFGANVNHATHDGDTLLMTAALRGHSRVVDKLLDAGADVDATNRWGTTALHMAALNDHVEVVRSLLQAGANKSIRNPSGKTALDEAERKNHAAVVQLLRSFDGTAAVFLQAVRRGDMEVVRCTIGQNWRMRGPHDRMPVHHAAKHGRLEVLQLLVSYGASLAEKDDAGWTVLHFACESGSVDVARFVLKQRVDVKAVDTNGRSAMDIAALNGKLDVVKELNRHGVSLRNVSSDGRTILHRAVTSKNTELIEFLVTQKVDINATDSAGWTPLHQAAHAGLSPVAAKLLELGADVNVVTKCNRTDAKARDSESALHLAIRGDHTHILPLLLAHNGIDINIPNDLGRSPLIFAVSLDRAAAADLLIKAGADVNAQGSEGESALLIASFRGSLESVNALLQNGAKTDVVARSGRTPLSVAKSPELKEVLQLYHNSQRYHEECFALLNGLDGTTPSIEKLSTLVPLITSVYDLRHMLTLVTMCDVSANDAAARLDMLNAAFTHVVGRKLTFDDHACVFFKMSLEACERENLLPRSDFLLLDRMAEKVNTESAEWVTEMKRQIHTNTWRLDAHEQCLTSVISGIHEVHALVMENRAAVLSVAHRVEDVQKQVDAGKKALSQLMNYANSMSSTLDNFADRLSLCEGNIQKVASSLQSFREAYVARIEQEEKNAKIKKVCGIVASIAGFVFAPVLKEIADSVVDFTNPIDIVAHIYGETDIISFLADEGNKEMPEIIQNQLDKFAIPRDEFETLLREEIVLQHPEYIEQCEKRGLTVSLDGGKSAVAHTLEPSLVKEESSVGQIISELRVLMNSMSTQTSGNSSSSQRGMSRPPSFTAAPVQFEPVNPPMSNGPSSSRGAEPSERLESQVNLSSINISDGEESVEFVDNLNLFPYHVAVQESHGDVGEFSELAELIDSSNVDANATMKIRLSLVSTSRLSLCAAEYAYFRGFRAVGDFLASRMKNPPKLDQSAASSVQLTEDPEEFPFIFAVDESRGSVEECGQIIEIVDEEDHPIDATIQADVVRVRSEEVEWTAVEYACHLGYVEIVKLMLKEITKGIPMKLKVKLLKFVCERSARGNAPLSA